MSKRPRLDSSYFGAVQDSNPYQSGSPQSPTDDQKLPQSAEVAADFKDSLQDLTMNNRYEISNLTVIAKESTEHALAISKVLEEHIRTIGPPRKLPALYVLDSIVKNVGTPYTIYFGQNLYKTFMEAYTLVDSATRKAMENMLKTWKEPTPGSMDSRPVFAPEVTRPIENALIKARTAVIQQSRAQQRTPLQNMPHHMALPGQPYYRNTPTPPQHDERRNTPLLAQQQQQQQQQQFAPPVQTGDYHQYNQQPQPPSYQNQQPAYQAYPQNVYGQQVAGLPILQQRQATPVNPTPPPATPQLDLAALLKAVSGQQAHQVQPVPAPLQQPLQSYPNATAQQPALNFPGLGALLQNFAQGNSTPRPQSQTPQFSNFPIPNNQVPTTGAAAAFSTPPSIPAQLAKFASPSKTNNEVKLTTASLKIPRPDLVSLLYGSQVNQCGTCGRRFPSSEDGRARKGRHLDWHFRTNMRLNDSTRKGVTRNWYMDELEWIRSREIDEADEAEVIAAAASSKSLGGGDYQDIGEGVGGGFADVDNNNSYYQTGGVGISHSQNGTGVYGGGDKAGAGPGAGRSRRERYVKAPTDAAIAHHACPICQEEFKTVWHDGAQEWVWMDAVSVGGRVFHASCMEDMHKDRGSTPAGVPNPQRSGSLKRELPYS